MTTYCSADCAQHGPARLRAAGTSRDNNHRRLDMVGSLLWMRSSLRARCDPVRIDRGPVEHGRSHCPEEPTLREARTLMADTAVNRSRRAPHVPRDLDHALQLPPLLVLAERVAVVRAREAALRG